jgi:hypothetical protein
MSIFLMLGKYSPEAIKNITTERTDLSVIARAGLNQQ